MIGNKPFAMRLDVIIGTTILLGFTAFAHDGRQFEPMEYDGLPYQQLACNVKGAKKPSLVIFLHGGHARGNDNQAQIQLPAVRDIKDFILTSNIPAYFLVPQCPSAERLFRKTIRRHSALCDGWLAGTYHRSFSGIYFRDQKSWRNRQFRHPNRMRSS